jgi:hypothetical protein
VVRLGDEGAVALRVTALAHASAPFGSGGTLRVCMHKHVAWRPAVQPWWAAPWLRQGLRGNSAEVPALASGAQIHPWTPVVHASGA